MGPDHPRNLIKIRNSVVFIRNFCKSVQISSSDYLKHGKDKVPFFITHLKDRNVSIYFLMGLDGFESEFFAFESNLLNFIVPDFYENFELYNKKYLTSQNARIFIKTILNKKILG